ncbi:MAG: aminotransferase class I/II-fold pyridoxal phosphate-dependent enzyme [Clostridiales bacterium]|nr:aminotransferase class I/II-fold pyridoxal phosphate-dependent enzyme [Clostridiales bacterium]
MENLQSIIKKSVREMPPSGIRKYFDLINEMDDVISLGIGEPDFVTPLHIREAGIRSLENGHTHYSANAGMIELREEIAKYVFRKQELRYNPKDEILVTVGASEGIDLPLRAILEKDDEVIVPEPSFVAYNGCIRACGGVPVPLVLTEDSKFKINPKKLEALITSKTKAVIIPFPNNPTGSIMTKEELSELVPILKGKNILILSDEVYASLTYGRKHASIAEFDEIKDQVIYINGFSKSHAMTGWRLGYICCNKNLLQHMAKIHQYALMCSPTVAQYAGIEALQNGDEQVAKMVNEYDRRRKYMVKRLNDMGLTCFEPEGAFYVFPNITSTNLTSEEFCERVLKEQKVLVVPGTAFGDSGEGFIRATYASSLENIEVAMDRIEKFIKGLIK